MRPTILVAEVLMLNDTVIEGYLRLIERRNQEGVHGFLTVLALDTFYMKDLEDGLLIRAARRFKKVNPFDTELIFTFRPLSAPTPNGYRLSIRWVALTYPRWKEYAQSHDLEWSPQAWLLHDTKTTWTVGCFSRSSRSDSPEGKQLKQDNSTHYIVWRVYMEEALRTSRLGAFDGHLAECQELLDPNFLNAEAWNLLACGVEDDTRRHRTEVPSRMELEYDAFMEELNEACDDVWFADNGFPLTASNTKSCTNPQRCRDKCKARRFGLH
ncbi:hypothetical protein J6590_083115 [Homalodisca vitripennis]|nr:hypothetical protein J6590_083115 [Homalodisca vitripennis]